MHFQTCKEDRKKFSGFYTFFLSVSLLLTLYAPAVGSTWGFWAHKRINRLAVFRLPAAMQVFYKKHIDYISESATNPDKRRYAVAGEAERHFIDLDVYGDSVFRYLPQSWPRAVEQLGEDSLRKHGIVPWHIQLSAFQLTEAFKMRDLTRILRLSAELGHYIADAHVPLHTTSNYNGQKTHQTGIHGFWESRLPELFAEQYDFWEGPAVYQENVMQAAWRAVRESSEARDSVLSLEKTLTEAFAPDKKYSYELRNNVLTRSYSREFSEQYHTMLSGQVERRMKASIRMTGDIWYTCWINAGQPELASLTEKKPAIADAEDEQTGWIRRLLHIRPEADD